MSTPQRMTEAEMSAVTERLIGLPGTERGLAVFGAIGGLKGRGIFCEIMNYAEPTASDFFRLLDEEVTRAENNIKKQDK